MAGIIILIMSVTGVLLAYERQVTAWADARQYDIVPPAREGEGDTRLPLEVLLARVSVATTSTPTGVTTRADASAPVTVNLAGGDCAQRS